MSHNAVELCTLLVEDLLGDLAATIFGALATHGRLPFDLLVTHTELHPRRLRAGLTALVQQNFVLWSPADRDRGPIHYEACLDRAERIGQYGRYITVVAARYGQEAGQIVEELLLHGSLRVCDIVKDCVEDTPNQKASSQKPGGPNGAMVNGTHVEESPSTERKDAVYNAMQVLREAEVVVNYLESYRRPSADNHAFAEDMIGGRSEFQGGPKSKNKALMRLEVSRMLQAWRRGIKDLGDGEAESSQATGNKRKARSREPSDEPPRKKLKANAVNALMDPSNSVWRRGSNSTKDLSRDFTCVRINFDKLSLLLRNDVLVQNVEKTFGHATAQVYAALVHLSVLELHACRSIGVKEVDIADSEQPYDDDPLVDTNDIVEAVDSIEDLQGSIAPIPESGRAVHPATYSRRYKRRPKPEKKKKKKDEVSSDEESEGETMFDDCDIEPNGYYGPTARIPLPDRSPEGIIRQHLFLLASHSTPFLTYRPPTLRSGERWSIPFPELMRALRLDLICDAIHTKHDDPPIPVEMPDGGGGIIISLIDMAGLRIARILAEVGKLDEKALTARSLLPPKVLRAQCAALHAAGFLELQEVPRDAQRQPARTMFLWFLDLGRAGNRVAEDARGNIVRLLQRRKMEEERRKGVLEKASRSDVRGHERELLNRAERVALERWVDAERRIWGGVARLGEAVALLHEY